jgi:hypothetical protein
MPNTNHGQSVREFVHAQQDAREEGGPRGIGAQVSEFARNKDSVDFADGVITVVKDEGGTETFATFADALAYADDGDTLQVGQGVYAEAIDLDESITIVGEAGAVIDGSSIAVSAGTQATIELFDGFSGGSISGLEVIAVNGGNAVVSIIGEAVVDVDLTGNTFDGGDNALGAVVYLNPGAVDVLIEGNIFEGASLTSSPLLGIEGDNILVEGNTFGETAGTYPKVEVFAGTDGTTDDVVLVGNSGLDGAGDVVIA